MATIQVNNVIQVRVLCSLGSQLGINVRHYRCVAVAGLSATDQDVANAMDLDLAVFYKQLMSVQATYRGVGAQIILPPPPTTEAVATATSGPGLIAGDALPPSTSGLISLRTVVATRFGRGRIYPPFPGEADNLTTGSPSVGYRAALTALADRWLVQRVFGAGGNTATCLPVLFRRTAGTTLTLVSFLVRDQWSQQRRRSFLRRGDAFPF